MNAVDVVVVAVDVVVVAVDVVVIDENARVVVLVAVAVEVGHASVLLFYCSDSFSFSFFYRPSYPS